MNLALADVIRLPKRWSASTNSNRYVDFRDRIAQRRSLANCPHGLKQEEHLKRTLL